MSVHNLAALDRPTAEFFGDERPCFHCHEKIGEVAVAWSGPLGADVVAILLHPDCAQLLAVRLASDGLQADRLLRGKPIGLGIDKTLIPEGEA